MLRIRCFRWFSRSNKQLQFISNEVINFLNIPDLATPSGSSTKANFSLTLRSDHKMFLSVKMFTVSD